MTKKGANMKHDELANNLARHLLHKDRMVWEDLPCGPAGTQRPDVLVMNKSFTKPNPIAYEVKVSVSDYRADVTEAKWRGYLNYAWGVIFAVPKGLITKNDLPDGCGLIVYNGEGWSTIKRPTLSPKNAMDTDFLLKLLMCGEKRRTQAALPEIREFNKWKHHEKLRKKFGKDIAAKLSLLDEYPEKRKQIDELTARICRVFNVPADRWGALGDVEYRIKKAEKAFSETEQVKNLLERLVAMKRGINMVIDKQITSLTPESELNP